MAELCTRTDVSNNQKGSSTGRTLVFFCSSSLAGASHRCACHCRNAFFACDQSLSRQLLCHACPHTDSSTCWFCRKLSRNQAVNQGYIPAYVLDVYLEFNHARWDGALSEAYTSIGKH